MKYTYELIAIFNDGDKKVVKKSNKNINEIDEFTSQFNNKRELINHLEDLFDKVIFDAKIKYTYLTGVTKTEKTMDILYKNDTVTQIYRVTGRDKLHVHAVASSSDEMELFLHNVIDTLPGIVSCSCNTILSRIKDIKGLRL